MKKIILACSFLGTIILYVLFNTREFGLCELGCGDWVDRIQNNFLFFPVILVFSIATFFLKGETFNSWWKFARIAIPIIFVISTIINLQLHHTPGGFFNMDNMFDLPIIFLMYAVFVLGSLIQIYRGYRNK
jgi:hypothetical protein